MDEPATSSSSDPSMDPPVDPSVPSGGPSVDESRVRYIYRDLLLLELEAVKQPKTTLEALVIGILKRLARIALVNWDSVLEVTSRQYILDGDLQQCLISLWEDRKRTTNTTPDEQHVFERLLAYENVKQSDLMKMSTYLGKGLANLPPGENSKALWRFFAVDGYMGNSDLKLYLEHFRNDEVKLEHARAVRKLYDFAETPNEIQEAMQVAFGKVLNVERANTFPSCDMCVETYMKMVPRIKEVMEWKEHQSLVEDNKRMKKLGKRKREAVEETLSSEEEKFKQPSEVKKRKEELVKEKPEEESVERQQEDETGEPEEKLVKGKSEEKLVTKKPEQ